MAHELAETATGIVRFAYNPEGGTPWHRLGHPVDGARTLEAMLALSHTEYMVQKFPIFTQLPDGSFEEVETHFMTGFDEIVLGEQGMVNRRTTFAPVGTVYRVEQNYEAVLWAQELLAATGGDGQIETIGALGKGERFFVTIELPELVVDPKGIADRIKRFIAVVVYHNGQHGLRAVNSDVRVVCSNTEQWALREGQMLATIRHTAGKEKRKEQAVEILRQRTALSLDAKAQAEQMLAIPVHSGQLADVVAATWGPKKRDFTDRQEKAWDQRHEQVDELFRNGHNAQRVGYNGWAAYNAVTEYIDHSRPRVGGRQRMEAAIDPTSEASKAKVRAARAVLALA